MPRTSQSASTEPNAPAESRCAIMRAARAGPIPGSDSMAAESARSMSTGPRGDVATRAWFSRFAFPRDARGLSRTESRRTSWRSSATTASGAAVGLLARHSRTLLPDNATMARNQSALRSLEVAMPGNYIGFPMTQASFGCVRYPGIPFSRSRTRQLRDQRERHISYYLQALRAELV